MARQKGRRKKKEGEKRKGDKKMGGVRKKVSKRGGVSKQDGRRLEEFNSTTPINGKIALMYPGNAYLENLKTIGNILNNWKARQKGRRKKMEGRKWKERKSKERKEKMTRRWQG